MFVCRPVHAYVGNCSCIHMSQIPPRCREHAEAKIPAASRSRPRRGSTNRREQIGEQIGEQIEEQIGEQKQGSKFCAMMSQALRPALSFGHVIAGNFSDGPAVTLLTDLLLGLLTDLPSN